MQAACNRSLQEYIPYGIPDARRDGNRHKWRGEDPRALPSAAEQQKRNHQPLRDKSETLRKKARPERTQNRRRRHNKVDEPVDRLFCIFRRIPGKCPVKPKRDQKRRNRRKRNQRLPSGVQKPVQKIPRNRPKAHQKKRRREEALRPGAGPEHNRQRREHHEGRHPQSVAAVKNFVDGKLRDEKRKQALLRDISLGSSREHRDSRGNQQNAGRCRACRNQPDIPDCRSEEARHAGSGDFVGALRSPCRRSPARSGLAPLPHGPPAVDGVYGNRNHRGNRMKVACEEKSRHHRGEQKPAALQKPPVHADQSKQQKRNIRDEDELLVGMVQKRRRKGKEACRKPDCPVAYDGSEHIGMGLHVAKPPVEKPRHGEQNQNGQSLNIGHHRDEGHEVARENQRIEHPVIRKVVSVLAGAHLRQKLRNQISGLVKMLPEHIRQHAVLALPVDDGPVAVSHGESADNYRQQRNGDAKKHQRVVAVSLF